ncbi:daunorubicin resistance protein DrrA family ABC transporter ATP-binding protein [Amycolatopsis methanolica]|uniref:Nodulation ABC transporter NodI n=1 Tax=Amycolatopsis methanolica 239 TaxID=1068978 RepID=A0A076MX89_AMYME|nr:daunorubicin resistance protein DrrA family ABC transporter ATP-binding protein [Amycolatopsis methanolica]AIJ23611.1 nodulation ABC transporter NodI [Amycolatopsis methanolica 239]
MSSENAVVAQGLRKRYGDKTVLADLNLTVPAGTVFGLLGPNGAGKTTCVRILATLLRPDAGTVLVAGFDARRQAAQVRYRIGLVGQHAAVDEVLSGRQNLEMFGRLYHLGARRARQRADELLARMGLGDAGDKPVKQYSGGMRRRLDLAAGLLRSPEVLFLDEPTTGLDPRGRSEVWSAVRELVADGATVLLTTQYLDEADHLAGRIAVLDHDGIVDEGSPAQLKSRIGGDRVEVVLRDAADLPAAAALASRVTGAAADLTDGGLSVPVSDRARDLTGLAAAYDEAGIGIADLTLRRPTLDEVFLKLTARDEVPA